MPSYIDTLKRELQQRLDDLETETEKVRQALATIAATELPASKPRRKPLANRAPAVRITDSDASIQVSIDDDSLTKRISYLWAEGFSARATSKITGAPERYVSQVRKMLDNDS